MAEPASELRRIQAEFSRYIRDPGQFPPPSDVPAGRMAIYRELFFNNMESLLGSGFPVLKALLPKAGWLALVHDFYAEHRSKTPLFAEIAQEFLDYLAEERGSRAGDPAFLLELAHYEWVELGLAIAETDDSNTAVTSGPMDANYPVRLSELAWPLAYRFPVHRIGPDFQPAEPPAEMTFLLAYRDSDETVRFTELNAITYRLLTLIQTEGPISPARCLERIAAEMAHPQPEQLAEFGAELIRDLGTRTIVLPA